MSRLQRLLHRLAHALCVNEGQAEGVWHGDNRLVECMKCKGCGDLEPMYTRVFPPAGDNGPTRIDEPSYDDKQYVRSLGTK